MGNNFQNFREENNRGRIDSHSAIQLPDNRTPDATPDVILEHILKEA